MEINVNKHKKMNINTPPVSKRIFNKVVKDMNPDLILKHTTQRGVQTRVWKEKS